MKSKITTLVIIASILLSCNTGKKTSSETSTISIENTKWVITTLEGKDVFDAEKNGKAIYFILNAEANRVNGYSGCNTFMGTYKIEEGNRISFSQMASTRRACPDAKINESLILNVFEMADNFTISGNKLMLNKAKRAPLAVFKKI